MPSQSPQLPMPAHRRHHPPWLKVRAPGGPEYEALRKLVHEQGLHTVCESATCPNIGECWNNRSLTIMILGNICTRRCGFCDVSTGRPGPVDAGEPQRVALALSRLNLKHAVITSVDRDDLPDGGAATWAETIRAIRRQSPFMTIEALIGDFKGRHGDQTLVFDSRPNILAHNLETVPRLSREVRPQARYDRSLELIGQAKAHGLKTKSGLMLGLGETLAEVKTVMEDLLSSGCDLLTLGQYLRPSKEHLPVARFVPPEEFQELGDFGMKIGYQHVEAAPLVRSSYHADKQAQMEFQVP